MRKYLASIVMTLVFVSGCADAQTAAESVKIVHTATPAYAAPLPGPRLVVMISDLHMGLGAGSKKEDFRWRGALKEFLAWASREGNDAVDLIIIGDAFEFWQPPSPNMCVGLGADKGCTLDEMRAISIAVSEAHRDTLIDLRDFSRAGQNRVHMLPGNHDAALLYDNVWQPIAVILEPENGRINFVSDGMLTLRDGRILIEHGHQIGAEVNKYDNWPEILTVVDQEPYVVRPWGEYFVQKLFNKQEEHYPIIDNLSPETAGARYRMEDRGVWGTASDVAQFVFFNLFETSLEQKAKSLGNVDPSKPGEWDLKVGRKKGWKLFAEALPANDPFRKELEGGSDEAKRVQAELNSRAGRLGDAEVKLLCDRIAINKGSLCVRPKLGALIESTFVPRDWVLAEHLVQRRLQYPKMRTFIYGHTHKLEMPHRVKDYTVVNTGAFQRVVDEPSFLARAAKMNLLPMEALRQMQVTDLAPCYTFALLRSGQEAVELSNWLMEEGKEGKTVTPGDGACQ